MDESWLLFFFVGLLAQLVDGALGMAFGVTATTVMLSFGTAPAQASAMVHIAEIFTTAASGTSHWWHRNVDWSIVRRIAIPGRQPQASKKTRPPKKWIFLAPGPPALRLNPPTAF